MNEPTSTNHATEPEVGYVAPPAQVMATTAELPMSRQALLARIGLLGIAAAALVAAALLVFSSSASPNGALAAGADDGTASGQVPLANGGGPGFRGGPGPGLGGITITSISGNSISLKTEDGWTRAITVDGGTTYTKSGATIALGDLKVGDEIGFRQTLESNGTWSIDSIVVILPRAGGEVTGIDGSSITVTQRDGSTATITVNGQTRYSVNGTDGAALSDVKVGMFLVAEGTKNSDGSLTAATVKAGSVSTNEGRGGFGRGFPFGPGPHWKGADPGASAAPGATGTAS
jgi:anti-sigma factor RsiW